MDRHSPFTYSFSRAHSDSSDSKRGKRHREFGFAADQGSALIVANKRHRSRPRRFPEREAYCDNSEESLPDQEMPKTRKKPNFAVEIQTSIRKKQKPVPKMGAIESSPTGVKPHSINSPTIEWPSLRTDDSPACEIKLLNRQIDFLAMRDCRKLENLENQLLILKDENSKLHRHLDWYRKMEKAKATNSSNMDEVKELAAELERKNSEIMEKIKQTECVTEQLNSAEGLNIILKDFKFGHVQATRFLDEMGNLERNASRAARVLVQCLSDSKIAVLGKTPEREAKLDFLVKSTLGAVNALSTHPKFAMCSLLSGFLRDEIFHADCWGALSREGYMLRGYQEVIEKSFPKGTLEGFHRATVEVMLEKNHQFRDCWVQSHVENARCKFLKLCNPFLDEAMLANINSDIQEALNLFLTDAFHFRARCVPPNGSHYEFVQFEPGDLFDPNFMEAREVDGTLVSVSDENLYLVKLCVHGCLVSHARDGNSVDAITSRTLAQAFVSTMDEGIGTTAGGTLKTMKAIVLLGDTVEP
ncbi:hypothetical protein N7508_010494 [Penicillium antarcticum]|uniref:uncharacterized protein n=1 Tax=Penicillium antarcticum TaxID=416450 RepID=UPI0023A26D87|nr:uncharacterized protein N7508_010494 [Penicillium antarcticum]KAJ5295673.1 hypothetical protein N7508_010494 [Penicillium antarcticum]